MKFQYKTFFDKGEWSYTFNNPKTFSAQKKTGFKTQDDMFAALANHIIEVNPDMEFIKRDPRKYLSGK